MNYYKTVSVLLLCVYSHFSSAEGTIISIEGAKIRGNQELPTVLYLVPWKPAKVYELEKPKQTLASTRPIKKLERASFKRMLSYHETFLNKAPAR